MDLKLKGKYALVTGGSRGIGRSIALSLADEGCNVAICARNKKRLEETVIELKRRGIQSIGIVADVMHQDDIDNVMQTVIKAWGTLHILINNVGGGGRRGKEIPEETGEEVWEEVYSKNALTAIQFTMRTLPYMLKQEWGRVITISSMYGYEGGGRPWFNMAKSAEISLMKCLSLMPRYVTKNITFNAVAPGFILIPDTGWEHIKNHQPEEYQKTLKELPRERLGTPEEVANLVTFLCSEKASLINGVTIPADGGQTKSF